MKALGGARLRFSPGERPPGTHWTGGVTTAVTANFGDTIYQDNFFAWEELKRTALQQVLKMSTIFFKRRTILFIVFPTNLLSVSGPVLATVFSILSLSFVKLLGLFE
jgi:hypothetical protein